MSAEPGSITRHADQFVPIAQYTERARPKHHVAGEIAIREVNVSFGHLTRKTLEVNPAGDTNFAGVVQQQNAALPRLRRRCDSVHPLHFRRRSSSAEVLAHGHH
jgi:hypothetical protein